MQNQHNPTQKYTTPHALLTWFVMLCRFAAVNVLVHPVQRQSVVPPACSSCRCLRRSSTLPKTRAQLDQSQRTAGGVGCAAEAGATGGNGDAPSWWILRCFARPVLCLKRCPHPSCAHTMGRHSVWPVRVDISSLVHWSGTRTHRRGGPRACCTCSCRSRTSGISSASSARARPRGGRRASRRSPTPSRTQSTGSAARGPRLPSIVAGSKQRPVDDRSRVAVTHSAS